MPLSNLLPTMDSVLSDREKRWRYRAKLAQKTTVVSMTLRLPHALRLSYPDILEKALSPLQDIGLVLRESSKDADGPTYFFESKEGAESVKRKTVFLEDTLPIGRFLDIDVSDSEGAISRSELGLPTRGCLVCGCRAWDCIKSRRHSTDEILDIIEKTLFPIEKNLESEIARYAAIAAEEELRLLYKPGLVTPITNGAHKDLDFHLMRKTLEGLKPFWLECAKRGLSADKATPEFLAELRHLGIEAEKRMFDASSGVNTYRGLLYLLGILCAAVSYALSHHQRLEDVFEAARLMASEELKRNPNTRTRAKEQGFSSYFGARGETASGFKTVHKALDFFLDRKRKASSRAEALTDTLIYLISNTYDTNVLGRGGREGMFFMQHSASEIMEVGGLLTQKGTKLYRQFLLETLQRNLSPGGAADLLICTAFLDRIAFLFGKKS